MSSYYRTIAEWSIRMAAVELSHGFRLGKHFTRQLYCDALLTKDGVATLPVHRVVIAAASAKFRRMFEEKDNKTPYVVPLIDFASLTLVVAYIYEGRVQFPSEVELDDFMTVLDMMKVELDGKVTKVRVGGKVKEEKVIQEDVQGKVKMESKFTKEELKCEEKKDEILRKEEEERKERTNKSQSPVTMYKVSSEKFKEQKKLMKNQVKLGVANKEKYKDEKKQEILTKSKKETEKLKASSQIREDTSIAKREAARKRSGSEAGLVRMGERREVRRGERSPPLPVLSPRFPLAPLLCDDTHHPLLPPINPEVHPLAAFEAAMARKERRAETLE